VLSPAPSPELYTIGLKFRYLFAHARCNFLEIVTAGNLSICFVYLGSGCDEDFYHFLSWKVMEVDKDIGDLLPI
jgi:hypothetical protein